jgi:GMP synthase (glutamine-hydrolysing)
MTDDAVTPYLLLQARDDSDPIKPTEVECFLRVGEFNPADLETRSLFDPVDSLDSLVARKAVFVGGSGDYSIVRGGPWLDNALQWMATLAKIGRPTFASCFGFQAMALALGGSVVTDLSRAELGTIDLRCTDEGRLDPLFAPLPEVFGGQAGHQDIVERIPDCAVLLAYAEKTHCQAFRLRGLPIYCTQFHPELDLASLVFRIRSYPEYVEKIAGVSFAEFEDSCRETLESRNLFRRFLEHYVN